MLSSYHKFFAVKIFLNKFFYLVKDISRQYEKLPKGEIEMIAHRLKIVGIVLTLFVTGVLMQFYGDAEKKNEQQRAIAKEVIRLHVIANSDSDADQNLKMKVKETVVTYLRGAMSEAENVEQAREIIQTHLREVEEIASEKIREEGYDYRVSTELGESYFPIKEYGDLTFPAGNYQALRVQIGESAGHNWWCVMYPSLCFVDSTYQVVPENSKEKLKTALTEEEYNSLLEGGKNVTYSSKIWEWAKKIVHIAQYQMDTF